MISFQKFFIFCFFIFLGSCCSVLLPEDWDDTDGDSILNDDDNCPTVHNPDQGDVDGDGEGDACDRDLDGDGIPNDACSPEGSNPFGGCDTDMDGDGVLNNADPDMDGDGVLNNNDNCPEVPNPGQAFAGSQHGFGRACDPGEVIRFSR